MFKNLPKMGIPRYHEGRMESKRVNMCKEKRFWHRESTISLLLLLLLLSLRTSVAPNSVVKTNT